MEVHAPHGPVNSWKEAIVHILIVTVGILIALGLDGLRETIHEHYLVQDARGSFRAELESNRENLLGEMSGVKELNGELASIIADLPALQQHPDQLPGRLKKVHYPHYFFLDTAWDAALSTGALAHMSTNDVILLGAASKSGEIYSGYEDRTDAIGLELGAYADSARLNPEQLVDCEHRLHAMLRLTVDLQHMEAEYLSAIDKALAVAK